MQLLEHEAKALAAASGLTVPEGGVASTPEQARALAQRLGGRVVLKAQLPAAGRAGDGGIQEVDADEAGPAAGRLLGSTVRGFGVRELLVERHVPSRRAVYVAVTIDARERAAVVLVSRAGGSWVEEHPDEVGRAPIPAVTGLRDWHVRRAAAAAGVEAEDAAALLPAGHALYRLFREQRARLVEVNPLLLPADGSAPVAADVRVVPGASPLASDFIELDPDGDVGLLTTGAGASMLLVDLLRDAGLRPLNFCDARTGGLRGDPSRLVDVLRRLCEHPSLRCIGVNVFAGITKLDEFAALLLQALAEVRPAAPVVVRIEGEAVEPARERLTAAGLSCVAGLDELVERLAAAARAGAA